MIPSSCVHHVCPTQKQNLATNMSVVDWWVPHGKFLFQLQLWDLQTKAVISDIVQLDKFYKENCNSGAF